MHGKKEFGKLASDFRDCREVLIALGDENRLHLLYQMMITENPMGIRVGEITKRTNLSRPAVSHHLKLLKDAGVVKVIGKKGNPLCSGKIKINHKYG